MRKSIQQIEVGAPAIVELANRDNALESVFNEYCSSLERLGFKR